MKWIFSNKLLKNRRTWSCCSSAPHPQCSSQCHGHLPSLWLGEWCLDRDPADQRTRKRENIGSDELQRKRVNKCNISICQKGTFISPSHFFSAQFQSTPKFRGVIQGKVNKTKILHASVDVSRLVLRLLPLTSEANSAVFYIYILYIC